MNKLKLQQQLEQFFLEDIGERDVTSDLIFGDDKQGEIVFIAKENGVFCGKDVIFTGFHLLNKKVSIEMYVSDGDAFNKGDRLAIVSGNVSDLLKGERVVLNLVQRMSAIATTTQKAVDILGDSRTRIVDTRKTTPGLRMMEKFAVRTGGGFNHRFGLYDGVMIKDNHISFAGSITNAVSRVRAHLGHMVKIEVEIETKEQLIEAIEAKADVIMFDNRMPEEIKEWIGLVPEGIMTEASGGITLKNLGDYKDTGVDVISLGFLTHTIKSIDISVKMNIF